MSRKSVQAEVATIGIDIGKNTFHPIGLDERGAIMLQLNQIRGFRLPYRARRHGPSGPSALAQGLRQDADHRPRIALFLTRIRSSMASRLPSPPR